MTPEIIPKLIHETYFEGRFWQSSLTMCAASLAVGAYIGYNDSKGAHLNHKLALAISPALIQGGFDGLRGFCFMLGSATGMDGELSIPKNQYGEIAKAITMVTSFGAAKGGIETLVGYAAGYVGGKFF